MMIPQAEYNQVIDGLRMQLILQRRLNQELLQENRVLQQNNFASLHRAMMAEIALAERTLNSKTKKGKK